MLTRKSVYEAHGFSCAPNYKTFDKILTEVECIQLSAMLEKLKKQEQPSKEDCSHK